MKTPFLLATALALSAALAGCEKSNPDPDGLPPATQEGKNTGGFHLNGVAFLPETDTPGSLPFSVSVFRVGNTRLRDVQVGFFKVKARSTITSFHLIMNGVDGPGQYWMRDAVSPYVVPGAKQRYASFAQEQPFPKREYLTGPTSTGSVFITRFDTVARVIAGTFEARLKEYQGPDSLIVTKGRFDLKF